MQMGSGSHHGSTAINVDYSFKKIKADVRVLKQLKQWLFSWGLKTSSHAMTVGMHLKLDFTSMP